MMTPLIPQGGASLKERMEFCNLDKKTKIPGYKGYCPRTKYMYGERFSETTKKAQLMCPCGNFKCSQCGNERSEKIDFEKSYEPNYCSFDCFEKTPDQPLEVPESTGFNKLTKKMVPGYTGYIPKYAFTFGKTYQEGCESCIKAHLNYKNIKEENEEEEDYRHPHFDEESRMKYIYEIKSSLNGAPPVGYTGYIPKRKTTEAGLGLTFNEAANKSLRNFKEDKFEARRSLARFNRLPRTCCCTNLI